MADPIITLILTEVATIMDELVREEIRLVSGVERDVKKLNRTFKSIKAVLVDAERREVKDESVRVWLENLKDVSYDTEDVLFEWITAIQKAKVDQDIEKSSLPYKKVFSFLTLPCSGISRVALRRDIAIKVKEINERLDVIAVDKDRYRFKELEGSEGVDRLKTTSFIDVSEVKGRDVDKDTLVKKLMSAREQDMGLNVVSIVGTGGIGKTTLAQVVYHSDAVINHFDMKMWVCVSEPFDDLRVAKAIVEDIEGNAPYVFELETVLRHLRDGIRGKKYLLVLDDVWTEENRKWEQIMNSLKIGAVGSTILVTTRKVSVAKMMGSSYDLDLGRLSDHDSWSLFSKMAFFERDREECEELDGVGRKIADKCKGLPLALKTIGSLMRFKRFLKDWQDVLDSEFWKREEAQEGLFPPLMLSYYDLPSPMKRCFAFCAFFPQDHVIDADNLIKLWMAQGYFNSTGNVEMEVTGRKYLDNLAMRSFFQDLEKDRDDKRILRFKMHDMVHAFAQYLAKNESSVMEVSNDLVRKMESSQDRVRHLTLVRSEDARFPDSIPNVGKLHSFWVQCFYDCPRILSELGRIKPEMFHRMARLKALDLSRNRLAELPKEVGKLINLKYLNLSHNPLWELPLTLCDLYNLQTINLVACYHLKKLPEKIGKLVNLRHLEIDGTDNLKTLPKGISNIISLQTLSKFIIVQGKDGEEAACKIQDLANLNNLQGRLKIEGLSYVANADQAKKAEMQKKKHLSGLHMDFSPVTQSCSNKDEVIEALQLHENLHILQISSFGGTNLPNWMLNLINLRELFLKDCQNCTSLPPLGRLPSLVTLCIEGMHYIKCLGLEFLGMDVKDNTNGSSTTTSGGDRSATEKIAFPKLKKLKISNMERWEDWNFIISINRGRSSGENVKIMPNLKCLKLAHCSKLKALPPPLLLGTTPLSKLRINSCTLLQQQYKKTGSTWKKHISKVRVS